MDKKSARLRRAKRTRAKIKQLNAYRLCVHRTPRHTYAQIIAPDGQVLASVSTLEQVVKVEVTNGGNIKAARVVGKLIADRCQKAGIKKVAFDRSGFKYHGRVEAIADAARKNGLEI
jgi:large subunit ribosomal protein L18